MIVVALLACSQTPVAEPTLDLRIDVPVRSVEDDVLVRVSTVPAGAVGLREVVVGTVSATLMADQQWEARVPREDWLEVEPTEGQSCLTVSAQAWPERSVEGEACTRMGVAGSLSLAPDRNPVPVVEPVRFTLRSDDPGDAQLPVRWESSGASINGDVRLVARADGAEARALLEPSPDGSAAVVTAVVGERREQVVVEFVGAPQLLPAEPVTLQAGGRLEVFGLDGFGTWTCYPTSTSAAALGDGTTAWLRSPVRTELAMPLPDPLVEMVVADDLVGTERVTLTCEDEAGQQSTTLSVTLQGA